jgi:hypothetical protein
MKATITFSLPEEQHEYSNAVEGSKMRSVLWELDQWLRAKLKYEELTDGQYDAFKETREHLRKLLREENVDIER